MHCAALLVASVLALTFAPLATAQTYSVVVQKSVSGQLRVERSDGGRVRTNLSYRDNGRGPDIEEAYILDAAGTPVEYAGTGTSTFGAKIEERFTHDGMRLRWTSRIDRGDEPAVPGALFLPLEGTAVYYSELARSVYRRTGREAPLAAGGTARVERATTLTVTGPRGPERLVLLGVIGADMEPWFYWFRDDDALTFFSVARPGFAIVPQGYEGAIDDLVAAVQRARFDHLAELQKRVARPLEGLTLIRNVRWFDAPAATMREPSDVYLRAGRIAAVSAPGQFDAVPDRVIDGSGKSLLPGLFDMHMHIWGGAGPLHLAAGVTSGRDMGGDNGEVLQLQDRFSIGSLPGPTLYPAGLIEGNSPYSLRRGKVVDSVEQGKAAIDWYAARGYRQIKLYNSIKPEWVASLTAHARARGITVAGHVPAFMKAQQAVLAGYDELTHVNQLMLNFVGKPGDDTRTLLRFTRVGDSAAGLDINGPQVRAFIRLLRDRKVVVDPTVGTFEALFTQQQGESNPSLSIVADYLPATWRRSLRSADADLEGEKLLKYRIAYDRMLSLVAALHKAGVTLVAGTDATPGIGLHRELELYVKAGIPAPEVLRIATWNGARVARAEAVAGSIAVGKAADLVLIDGDPATRISDIRRTALVIKGSAAYRPQELYEAMGFRAMAPSTVLDSPAAVSRH